MAAQLSFSAAASSACWHCQSAEGHQRAFGGSCPGYQAQQCVPDQRLGLAIPQHGRVGAHVSRRIALCRRAREALGREVRRVELLAHRTSGGVRRGLIILLYLAPNTVVSYNVRPFPMLSVVHGRTRFSRGRPFEFSNKIIMALFRG
jgi:hypothetical protein